MGNAAAGSALPYTMQEESWPGFKARNSCGWSMLNGVSNKDRCGVPSSSKRAEICEERVTVGVFCVSWVCRTPVSIFKLDKKAPSTTRRNIVLAQNCLSRLRTVRHPNVLKFLVWDAFGVVLCPSR